MEVYCQFCNEKRAEDHIEVCPSCNGQLHVGSKAKVCATCGRSFPLESKPRKAYDPKPKELEPKIEELTSVTQEEE
ncbi:MAG: double zinc ribbon domain-containing protein [Anaerolineaceae bacterium]